MAKEKSQSNVRERTDIREPHKWAVIFWNDDFTTMDFVVKVLHDVFLKSENEAEKLMMDVHEKGSAVVGLYTYDVAVSRTQAATGMAREEGFPLKITFKEV